MKISKLFHWLYATLMFLPLLFLVPTLIYYGFNEHATNIETTTINYKYESNDVNSLDDLIDGNIYYIDELIFNSSNNLEDTSLTVIQCNTNPFLNADFTDQEGDNFNFNNVSFTIYITGNIDYQSSFTLSFNVDNNLYFDVYDELILNDIIFIYDNSSFKDYLEYNLLLPQYTDYNVIESVSVNTDDTITDKVNRSFERIFDLPLFAWTKTTFVSAPFIYITGLFGLTSDNPINYLFGYFVTISICWLVFDLIIYVPNLAHRWLDKGAIE